ncbi:hypothetical protein BST81_00510 [Leptolyngbya sp. 'hensonii']|nr:hypothetical protein BST81_00510 [Leptolyngbya sp. 'hensonii']
MPAKRSPSKPRFSSNRHAQLHRKLVTMVGHEEAARRLLLLVRERHPQKSIEWVYEKAIFDLERDRGRY